MCSEPCVVHWWRCVNFVHAVLFMPGFWKRTWGSYLWLLHMAVFVQSTFLTLTVHAGIPQKCMFLSAFYYLLLSCILATKPVRGICGVSWTTGGGGGGATDTGATTIRQKEQPRDREQRRCLDRKKDRRHRKKSQRASQRRENPNWACKRGEGRRQKACEQAKIAHKALLSNSFENFQSVFFCAAFFKLDRTGLHLISAWESTSSASVLKIKRKSCSVFNAVKELQSTTQTQKHDSYSCKITLQEDRYGFSKNLQESH